MILGAILSVIARRASSAPSGEVQWHKNDDAVYNRLKELWRGLDEIDDLLAMLKGGGGCAHVRLLIKLYYIAVGTLADSAAILINEVCDLGYQERDITIASVTRNRHVRALSIPDLIHTYQNRLEWNRYKRVRNDIVHRNLLVDDELDALAAREAGLISSAALFYEGVGDATPQHFFDRRANETGLSAAVERLAVRRADVFTEHFRDLKLLLDDIANVLATRLKSQS
jgi:Cthe_2314-like HEPN